MKSTYLLSASTAVAAIAALAVVTCIAAVPAHAHGDDHRPATTGKFDSSRVEEKDFGREGDPRRVTRTVQLAMADTMRFTPADVTVKKGETIRFVVRNNGKVLHEMVLGTVDELKEHAALMRKFPGMEHAEPHMAHVKPSTAGEIVWQFTKPGEFQFACLIPGHFEAGMVGKVTVK